MKVLSLFDGISAGYECLKDIPTLKYLASEIDPVAIKVAKQNHPNIIHIGDVKDVKYIPNVDLLLGGSPCTNLSLVGKMEGINSGDSALFWEFIRVLKLIKPKYFLFENVKMSKKDMDIITKNIGVFPYFIDSKHFSPQSRKRFYWTNISYDILLPSNHETIKNILDKNTIWFDKMPPSYYQTRKGNKKMRVELIQDINSKSRTITANSTSIANYCKSNNQFHKFTVSELERLQGFSCDYLQGIPKTKAMRLLGLSWNIPTIKYLLKGIK